VNPRPWIGVILALVGSLSAADESPVAQRIATDFHHTSWSAKDGLPDNSTWLAQGTDGWLWIGGAPGLMRFDGATFEAVELGTAKERTSDSIYSMHSTSNGELWLGHNFGGITRRRAEGSFEFYGVAEGVFASTITSIAQDASGGMWAASSDGLERFDGQRWHKVGADAQFPDGPVYSLYVDQRGTIWVSHESAIYSLAAGDSRFRKLDRQVPPGGAGFLQSPDGRTWYINAEGVHLLPDQSAATPRDPRVTAMEGGTAIFDRQGALWSVYPKVLRIPAPVPENVVFSKLEGVDSFSPREGLSGPVATAVLEDREGNIWVKTPGGVDRFRATNVRPTSFDTEVPYHVGLVAAEDGAIWVGMSFGTVAGPHDGLWKYDGHLTHAVAEIPGVTAIHRDAHGTLWIGTAHGVWQRTPNGDVRKLPELPASAGGAAVQTLAVDAAGDLWVSVGTTLYRCRQGAWQPFGNLGGFPQQRAMAQTMGSDGRMWFGYVDGNVAAIRGDSVKQYTSLDGLPRSRVTAIGAGRDVVVAAEDGVQVLRDERFHRLIAQDKIALHGVSGMLQLRNGDLWLNGARGAVRIDGRDLERAVRTGTYIVPLEVFDVEDGYPGVAQEVRP
jgi:ligand-binding sensor domain-containing protein